MLPARPAAFMVHVPDVEQALAWYQRAFPGAVRTRVPDPAFEFLVLGDVRLEFVPADDKVAAGPCGTVVYWEVSDFDAALADARRLGARLYRGPLRIESGQAMCQLQDPWNNSFGLRGPVAKHE
jgi:predicted enzyme related to lactoylglutathione lyase